MKKNRRLIIILASVKILLLIPLMAMQFTDEVQWSLSDFILAGILLGTTGLTIELVLRKVTGGLSRIALVSGILVVLVLIWAELAVGIFGTPFAGS